MDPRDNCWNERCNDHDLESYHCCIKYQTRDPIKCDNYISRENDHKLQKLLGKEAALAIKKQTDKKLEPLKSVIDKPKTKRVAVIWFGDVPLGKEYSLDNCSIMFWNNVDASAPINFKADPILSNRLRYEIPEEGQMILTDKLEWRMADKFGYDLRRLVIDPEPETVEQVMKSMPHIGSYTDDPDGDMSYENALDLAKDFNDFSKRLEAAKEREE